MNNLHISRHSERAEFAFGDLPAPLPCSAGEGPGVGA